MTAQMNSPLLAIVGMTDAGKTAFLRTFLHDVEIGEVSAGVGTTKTVTEYPVFLKSPDDTLFVIADTPGFQTGGQLRSLIKEQFPERDIEELSIEEIYKIIPKDQDNDSAAPFRHDQQSWGKILESDGVLVILDISEDPDKNGPQRSLIPYWKMIQKEKPVIVLLNKSFSLPDGDDICKSWRSILKSEGIKNVLIYDAHSFRPEDEEGLFALLAFLYPMFQHRFEQKKEIRRSEDRERRKKALLETVHYLLKVARTRVYLGKEKGSQNRFESERAEKEFIALLKKTERDFIDKITSVYGFSPSIVSDAGDLKSYVRRVEEALEGRRVAAGAAAGAVIDTFFCGFTLGAGSILGAAAGAVAGKAYDWTLQKVGSSSGKLIFFVPDIKFLEEILDRSVGLCCELSRRGHGTLNTTVIKLGDMPILNIPVAIEQLQRIASSNWTNDVLAIPSAAMERFKMMREPEYIEKDSRELFETLCEFLGFRDLSLSLGKIDRSQK